MDNKEKFLRNEFLTLTLFGALGRSNTYSESASDREKERFRQELRDALEKMVKDYTSEVGEDEHLSNIKKLSDDLSLKFSHCLQNKRYRIGIAQKALNLYLKYLWSAGLIPEPPHCPFDISVINHLKIHDLNWTSIDSMNEYKRLVKVAKKEANSNSLSEWELEIWNAISERRTTAIEQRLLNKIVNKEYSDLLSNLKNRMPREGDIFKGRINDLGNYDQYGWRRRDIWFFKAEVNRNELFGYPNQFDSIVLTDTDSNRCELNFSAPEMEDKVCLGTPSRLKPWYNIKGFEEKNVAPNNFVYFEYTGKGYEFFIFTENEYRLKQIN